VLWMNRFILPWGAKLLGTTFWPKRCLYFVVLFFLPSFLSDLILDRNHLEWILFRSYSVPDKLEIARELVRHDLIHNFMR